MTDRIILSPRPKVGLAITTYASPAHVALGLTLLRRNAGDLPVLVHDDCSPRSDEVREVAGSFGAAFSCSDRRLGHTAGDLMAFSRALRWAEEQSLDLLVKFSRRWVPLRDWVGELSALAYVSQYATYSGGCPSHRLGFRTECIALHPPSWIGADALTDLDREVKGGGHIAEVVMHNLCRRVHRGNCVTNQLYEVVHPRPPGGEAYGLWGLLGTSKRIRREEVLWHETHAPHEYAAAAEALGLSGYSTADFTAPV